MYEKEILEGFLQNICRISDRDYQERIWIKGEGPEAHDFTEAVCEFFDEGEPIIENYEKFGITKNQYNLLIEFRNEFDAFLEGPRQINYLPQQFIDTPEWEKIMNLAKEVLKAFNYQKNI